MNALRWLVFLPATFVLIAAAQFVTATLAERLSPSAAIWIVVFSGVLIVFSSLLPCIATPRPAVAAAILLTLFITFEIFALLTVGRRLTGTQLFIRLYTDAAVIVGGLFAARWPAGASNTGGTTPGPG